MFPFFHFRLLEVGCFEKDNVRHCHRHSTVEPTGDGRRIGCSAASPRNQFSRFSANARPAFPSRLYTPVWVQRTKEKKKSWGKVAPESTCDAPAVYGYFQGALRRVLDGNGRPLRTRRAVVTTSAQMNREPDVLLLLFFSPLCSVGGFGSEINK